jgi:hypothetical protein
MSPAILFLFNIFFINNSITIIIRTRSRHIKSKTSPLHIMSPPTKPDTPPPDVPPPANPDTPTSSSTFVGTTVGTRPDHVAWKCRKSHFCNIINPLTDGRCATCRKERQVPADALNSDNKQIGWLQAVDPRGNEKWCYFDSDTLDQIRQGTLPADFLSNSPTVSWGASGSSGSAARSSREGKRARTGDGFEVSHMERPVPNVVNKEVDDMDLEDPAEQPEDDDGTNESSAKNGSGSKTEGQ